MAACSALHSEIRCLQCIAFSATPSQGPCRPGLKVKKASKVEMVHQSQNSAPAGSAGTKAGKGLLELGKENDLANQTAKAEPLNRWHWR